MKYENKKYLEWVRKQPCCLCKFPGPNHPHHIKGVGYLSGVGLKAPDWATMPLCLSCHNSIHRIDNKINLNIQWEWLARTLGKAVEQGVL